MKTPYLYFGRKGYYAQAGVAPSTGVAALTAITNANGGMLPIVKANSVDPTTLGYRVVHKAVDAVDDKRGTDYTTDFVTGELFASTTAWDAAKNADDIQAGQVTNLTSASAFIVGSGDQVVTIGDNTATGGAGGVASGITMTTNDTVWVEEFQFNAAVLPINTVGADLCVPASSFLGAEPLAYTAGTGVNAGKHYDGTDLDKTRLYFKSACGVDDGADTVDFIHTAGKYKDLLEAINEIANSTIYERAIKVHHLNSSGQILHSAISGRGIRVYGCTITSIARS
tara:strand:+ start:117 stop:965 length:849 start_codon:yes stop_codon:yes gene_type:complete